MTSVSKARLSDIVGILQHLYPFDLAEDWDNVGLQVGDPAAEISRILVSLDAEDVALAAAENSGAQLLLTHHPLIFRPLTRLSVADTTGAAIFRAIKHDIAVISLHTNLDRAADGLNDWLAQRLGIENLRPLEPPREGRFYKVVVYVPKGYEQALMEALFAAGAGHIGAYDRCSFRTAGTGSFRGGESTQPFIGKPGEMEETEEFRLETISPAGRLSKVVTTLLKVHPYEEVAYDIIPLGNSDPRIGLGRVGHLKAPLSLQDFARLVREELGTAAVRVVGELLHPVHKIAVCGGTGMSTYADAVRSGADCLVTGDVKYHEAQKARADRIALIDAGHFATERIIIEELAARLRSVFHQRRLAVEVLTLKTEEDPFLTLV